MVDMTLQQQVVAAIVPKYLQWLQISGMNKIRQTIPKIFEHLFQTYGDVTPQDLWELIARVENISLPPEGPVDKNFAEKHDLATIAKFTNTPISEH